MAPPRKWHPEQVLKQISQLTYKQVNNQKKVDRIIKELSANVGQRSTSYVRSWVNKQAGILRLEGLNKRFNRRYASAPSLVQKKKIALDKQLAYNRKMAKTGEPYQFKHRETLTVKQAKRLGIGLQKTFKTVQAVERAYARLEAFEGMRVKDVRAMFTSDIERPTRQVGETKKDYQKRQVQAAFFAAKILEAEVNGYSYEVDYWRAEYTRQVTKGGKPRNAPVSLKQIRSDDNEREIDFASKIYKIKGDE